MRARDLIRPRRRSNVARVKTFVRKVLTPPAKPITAEQIRQRGVQLAMIPFITS